MVQIILKKQEVYGFIVTVKQLTLMQILRIQIIFNLSSITQKLLENTEADGAKEIFKNATIAVPM